MLSLSYAMQLHGMERQQTDNNTAEQGSLL